MSFSLTYNGVTITAKSAREIVKLLDTLALGDQHKAAKAIKRLRARITMLQKELKLCRQSST